MKNLFNLNQEKKEITDTMLSAIRKLNFKYKGQGFNACEDNNELISVESFELKVEEDEIILYLNYHNRYMKTSYPFLIMKAVEYLNEFELELISLTGEFRDRVFKDIEKTFQTKLIIV